MISSLTPSFLAGAPAANPPQLDAMEDRKPWKPSHARTRKDLCMDAMLAVLHGCFEGVSDMSRGDPTIRLHDVLMSGFDMMALDGTCYSFPEKLFSPFCLVKSCSTSGRTIQHLQAMGAAVFHPDSRTVIPPAPEPIYKQDGATRNVRERHAARPWLGNFRNDHATSSGHHHRPPQPACRPATVTTSAQCSRWSSTRGMALSG
jgi:hypothetical protein